MHLTIDSDYLRETYFHFPGVSSSCANERTGSLSIASSDSNYAQRGSWHPRQKWWPRSLLCRRISASMSSRPCSIRRPLASSPVVANSDNCSLSCIPRVRYLHRLGMIWKKSAGQVSCWEAMPGGTVFWGTAVCIWVDCLPHHLDSFQGLWRHWPRCLNEGWVRLTMAKKWERSTEHEPLWAY